MTKTTSKAKRLSNLKSLLRGLNVHVNRAVKLGPDHGRIISALIKGGESWEEVLEIEIARLESEL